MPVNKNELERAYVQLRRIAEHREVGAEKEIRRIYKELLADLKQFIGAEYADKGNLTYEILHAKGEYARFLEEIQRRCDNITPKMEREITDLVNEVYRAVYDGTVAAVQKAADAEQLGAELNGLQSATPEVIKRAVENPIAGLTLKDTLEKKRQDIIYDIKRNIGVGLTNGDRVDTMARRISQSLDGDYKKSIRIARTEAHRVRESGMHDAARQVDAAIKDSGADMRMVKTWRTMKDERVRPNHRVKTKHGWKTYTGGKANHQKMEGVTVLADEQFTLSDGSKTDAPGNSGVASQDINCRCFVEYSLMTDEEFFEATGRHFAETDRNTQANLGGFNENADKLFTNGESRDIIKTITVDDVEIAVHGKEIDPAVTGIIKKHFTGEHDGYYVSNLYVKPIPKAEAGTPLIQTVARKSCRIYETDIVLNEDLFRGTKIGDLNEKVVETKKNVIKSFEEAVIHEVGHAKTIFANRFNNIDELFNELEKMGVDDISDIALQDGGEAIAEIEVLLNRGTEISEDAKKLYNRVMSGKLLDELKKEKSRKEKLT